jgi:hypothetical protein
MCRFVLGFFVGLEGCVEECAFGKGEYRRDDQAAAKGHEKEEDVESFFLHFCFVYRFGPCLSV